METDPLILYARAAPNLANSIVVRKDYSKLGSNAGEKLSWPEMAKYTITSAKSELYYFVENDYLHRNGAIDCIFEFFSDPTAPAYLSLADHLDYYHLPIHLNRMNHMLYSQNFLFKQVANTTASFAVRANEFKQDLYVFLNTRGDFDAFNTLTGIM
jgi:hypothetical protein